MGKYFADVLLLDQHNEAPRARKLAGIALGRRDRWVLRWTEPGRPGGRWCDAVKSAKEGDRWSATAMEL